MQTCIALVEGGHDPHVESFDPLAFEREIAHTITGYGLFTKESRVLVACSGGKDSTVLLTVLKKLGYHVEAVTVDAHIGCYTEENLKNLRRLCQSIGVTLHEIAFRKEFGRSMCYLQTMLKAKGYDYRNCHTCGVLRRYLLNKHARALGADVLATGHNLDDEAQAGLMNLLRGQLALAARSGPKTGGKDARFIPRVKPMYFCREKDVVAYAKRSMLPVKFGECPCSSDSYRRQMRELLKGFPDPDTVKENVVRQLLALTPELRARHAGEAPASSCEGCGEPSAGTMCAACSLLAKLKDDQAPARGQTAGAVP